MTCFFGVHNFDFRDFSKSFEMHILGGGIIFFIKVLKKYAQFPFGKIISPFSFPFGLIFPEIYVWLYFAELRAEYGGGVVKQKIRPPWFGPAQGNITFPVTHTIYTI